MHRLLTLAVALMASIAGPTISVSGAEVGKGEAGAYVRAYITTSYGKDSTGKWVMFFKRRDVSLLNVKADGITYHVSGLQEVESFYTINGERRKKPLMSSNTVPIEETYNLNSGAQFWNAPPKSLFISAALPITGCEYFFLPMYDTKQHKLKAGEGVVNLQSPKQFRTQFSGVSTYRVARTPRGHKQVSLPFRLASSDGHYVMQGTLETTIDESPLTFIDMKGEIMVTVDPAEKWEVIGFAEKPKPFLKKFSKVCGYYHYQMVPMDSKEGKLIRHSDRLREAFKKTGAK